MKQFNIFYYAVISIMTAVFVLSLILLLMWYDKDIYSIAGQEYVRETRHYHNVTRHDYFPIEHPEDILSSFLFKGNVQHLSKMFELDLMQSDTAIENNTRKVDPLPRLSVKIGEVLYETIFKLIYMECLVIIVPDLSKKVDVRKIKKEIVSYVDTRLIDESATVENSPGVVLKDTISDDDKEQLSKLMSKDELGVLVFIDVEEDANYPEYWISTKAYE